MLFRCLPAEYLTANLGPAAQPGPAAELTQTDEAAGSALLLLLARIETSVWPDNVQLQRKTRHKMDEPVMKFLIYAIKTRFHQQNLLYGDITLATPLSGRLDQFTMTHK